MPTTDVYPINPKGCAALTWRGSPYGDTPDDDEFCDGDAVPGSDYCADHQWNEDNE